LFNELPSVTDQALKTFTPLAENVYTLKNLGDSGQEEFMSCDCKPYYPDSTGINHACGEDSDCINRLTSIECLMDSPDHPNNCGKACSNQRMQRCQYAPVDVIQTAQKGFGLRALQDIQANTFVYEYIGEIINQDRFVKRTQAYQQQGVKHFYFMMLQKNEFIDATQKGCLARFCNHSCNPNSYVDKWIVGSKLRMGIFAKRTVLKGEEITFDYNVDRYGADAQKCYCGEPNCIGYLGGKTQTDSVNKLPQMIIDALGLTESDEKLFIKKKISVIKEYQSLQATQQSISGSQQQQLSQETLDKIYDDLLPIKEIHEDTVSRTMGSLIQCKDAWLVRKLVKRIFITDDTSIHLKVIRMHGYEIFSKLLRNWSQPESLNKDVIVMILRILKKWPKMTRNKISSSKIEDIIKSFTEDGDVELHTIKDVYTLAQGLIEDWSNLQMAYRIPRRERTLAQSLLLEDPNNNSIEDSENRNTAGPKLPSGWKRMTSEDNRVYYCHIETNQNQWDFPTAFSGKKANNKNPRYDEKNGYKNKNSSDNFSNNNEDISIKTASQQQTDLQKIIEEANLQVQLKAQLATLALEKSQKEEQERRKKIKLDILRQKERERTLSSVSNLSSTEQAYTKLFARYVPNFIKKYESQLSHDLVKRHAKDIVKVLAAKEMKLHNVKSSSKKVPKSFDEKKLLKIKHFSREYMEKVMKHYGNKQAK
ncbi:SET domain-containing protein, partial [Nadsonia fulvescens var. elongata DSM 6958]